MEKQRSIQGQQGTHCEIPQSEMYRPGEKCFLSRLMLEGFRLSCHDQNRWIPGTSTEPVCTNPCPLSPPPSLPHAQYPMVAATLWTLHGGWQGGSRCGKGGGGCAGANRDGMEPAKPRHRVPRVEEGELGPRARATPGYCRVPLLVADSRKLDALCG